MSLFKKYLEIIQEGMYTDQDFKKVRMNQNKDMDYITFSMPGMSEMYVCDKNGEFCDPKTTKISDLKEMIESELGDKLTYSEKFLSMKNNDKATAVQAFDKGVDPFNEGFLSIVSQKKPKK